MTNLFKQLLTLDTGKTISKQQMVANIKRLIKSSDYVITELNDEKPWGAYFRFGHGDSDKFINEFFSNLNDLRHQLGENGGLSLKLLLVEPNQGVSWQYHERRAEIWSFINDGFFARSINDVEGEPRLARSGDIVQFAPSERHRLIGHKKSYTIVAEIWQHTDLNNLSDEDDIVRLADYYAR